MLIHRYELTDEQWDKIKSQLPTYTRGRPIRHDNRKILNAIIWINHAGAPWRDLPKRYGSWKTVYTKFRRWARAGGLECIFRTLASDADTEYVHIDSMTVSAHQHSVGTKQSDPNREENQIGRSRGGNPTKIHALVDSLGNLITFMLSEGNRHDSPIALELLKEVSLTGVNVVGDKAYGGIAIRNYITNKMIPYTIPPKETTQDPWTTDWWIYKERHSIKYFFNRSKHFRRTATRYDKTAYVLRTFIYVATTLLLLR
ncbi:IS5 family transposase [Loigolactobacillus coryniformis]|uniref:IS5 family transposase n=1 Tax=Loigolactobacillus coryniformis TaxID=1610 RepID=UPI003F51C9F3